MAALITDNNESWTYQYIQQMKSIERTWWAIVVHPQPLTVMACNFPNDTRRIQTTKCGVISFPL